MNTTVINVDIKWIGDDCQQIKFTSGLIFIEDGTVKV